jgi:hypothetical protein
LLITVNTYIAEEEKHREEKLRETEAGAAWSIYLFVWILRSQRRQAKQWKAEE